MTKVSIIVPVYNASEYLNRCIDSLIGQTLKDIEIILINDGSTDNSDEIIKSYKKDKRIKYISKDNEGIGKTRNLGIEKSKGEYLVFVDSDDFVKDDYCEELYTFAKTNNCDFVISDYINYIEETKEEREIKLKDFLISPLSKNPDIMNNINLGPCNKMYSGKLIRDGNIRFPENVKYEDVPFVCRALKKAQSIGKVNKAFCYFSVHEGSQTTVRDEKLFDILKIMDMVKSNFASEPYTEEVKTLLVNTLINYTIQARYLHDRRIRNSFINACFKYLKSIDKKWFNYISDVELKSYIFKSKFLVKAYCRTYPRHSA